MLVMVVLYNYKRMDKDSKWRLAFVNFVEFPDICCFSGRVVAQTEGAPHPNQDTWLGFQSGPWQHSIFGRFLGAKVALCSTDTFIGCPP